MSVEPGMALASLKRSEARKGIGLAWAPSATITDVCASSTCVARSRSSTVAARPRQIARDEHQEAGRHEPPMIQLRLHVLAHSPAPVGTCWMLAVTEKFTNDLPVVLVTVLVW